MLDFLLPLKGDNFNEIHLLPYHKIGQSKYTRFLKRDRMRGMKEPLKEELVSIETFFKNAGFKVKIHN
jgi:pyruvate-formate lyase-activating enzyme